MDATSTVNNEQSQREGNSKERNNATENERPNSHKNEDEDVFLDS
jgi:hypothetical protein